MDMHPAGGPRLVGPAGPEMSFRDPSIQFRFLPNSTSESVTPCPESLLLRHKQQTVHLQHPTSPTPRSPGSHHHPLLLREEHPKAKSPRGGAPPQLLLPSNHSSFFPLQIPKHATDKKHSLILPDLSRDEELFLPEEENGVDFQLDPYVS